jgi:hypothetical protein
MLESGTVNSDGGQAAAALPYFSYPPQSAQRTQRIKIYVKFHIKNIVV